MGARQAKQRRFVAKRGDRSWRPGLEDELSWFIHQELKTAYRAEVERLTDELFYSGGGTGELRGIGSAAPQLVRWTATVSMRSRWPISATVVKPCGSPARWVFAR